MKTYKMLKTAKGSRDGLAVETFNKGETYELDESLAEQFYEQGLIDEVKKNPAESRETKVIGPDETKVDGPDAYKGQEGEAGINPATQRIEELNATARDHHGLNTDTTMEPQAVREALAEAADGNDPALPASNADPLTSEDAPKSKKGKK